LHCLCEFDLSLAYGYSALNGLMPSGFCTGFFLLKEEEEEEEDAPSAAAAVAAVAAAAPMLIKTDVVRRHQTFEFKAVFFTLRKLMSPTDDDDDEAAHPFFKGLVPLKRFQTNPLNICTVYSNFSPSGLFYLDKYRASDLGQIFSMALATTPMHKHRSHEQNDRQIDTPAFDRRQSNFNNT
jgi:hypothetical protein